jgi:hypothetical protein
MAQAMVTGRRTSVIECRRMEVRVLEETTATDTSTPCIMDRCAITRAITQVGLMEGMHEGGSSTPATVLQDEG